MNLGFASWFFSFHGACYVHVYCTKFLLLSFLVGVDLLKFMFYWQLCKNDGKARYIFSCAFLRRRWSSGNMVARAFFSARSLLAPCAWYDASMPIIETRGALIAFRVFLYIGLKFPSWLLLLCGHVGWLFPYFQTHMPQKLDGMPRSRRNIVDSE